LLVVLQFGTHILRVVYNEEYAKDGALLGWTMLAGIPTYVNSALCYGIAARRLFVKAVVPMIGITAITCVLAVSLISRFGVIGASYAMVIAASIMAVRFLFVLWRNTPNAER